MLFLLDDEEPTLLSKIITKLLLLSFSIFLIIITPLVFFFILISFFKEPELRQSLASKIRIFKYFYFKDRNFLKKSQIHLFKIDTDFFFKNIEENNIMLHVWLETRDISYLMQNHDYLLRSKDNKNNDFVCWVLKLGLSDLLKYFIHENKVNLDNIDIQLKTNFVVTLLRVNEMEVALNWIKEGMEIDINTLEKKMIEIDGLEDFNKFNLFYQKHLTLKSLELV